MASRNLGSLTIDLIAKIAGFTGPMSKAEREFDTRTKRMNRIANDFGRNLGGALRSAAGQFLAFAGVAVSIDAAASGIKNAIDRADQLRDASIRLGVGVETLSAFGFAAQQTGTNIEELNKGLLRLSRNAQEALNPKSRQAGLFNALGIDKESLSDLGQLLPQIADRFAQLQDGAQKAALAQELFGRSGANLTEFLNQGSAGLQEMGDRARELGIIIDRETADAADEFNDKLGELKAAGTGLATQVASELLPELSRLVDWARDFVSDGDNAKQIALGVADGMRTLAQAVQLVVAAGSGLGQIREQLAGAEQAWRSFAGNFGANGVVSKALKEAMPWAYKPLIGGPDFSNVQSSPFANVRGGSDTVLAGSKSNPALDRFFATGGKSGGDSKARKEQLTDEQKEAKRLQEQYESLLATMDERIALFGAESEVAKLAYDTQKGELSKLTAAEKDALMVRALKLDAMEASRKEIEAEAEAMARQRESVQELLADIAFESELLGKSAEEQELLNNLRWAGVDANSAYGESIRKATVDMQEQRRATEVQIEAADGLRDAYQGFMTDLKNGEGLIDSLKNALLDLADAWFQAALRMSSDQLFGQPGTTGAGSAGAGWLGTFMEFWGSANSGFGFANGGTMSGNSFAEVNERGFEMVQARGRSYLLTGEGPVRVTPNHMLGGGGSVTQQFYTMGTETRETRERKAQLAGREARRAMARTGR